VIEPRFNALIELLGRLLAQQVLAELDDRRKGAEEKQAADDQATKTDSVTARRNRAYRSRRPVAPQKKRLEAKSPKAIAACRRPWPAMTVPSSAMSMGLVQPYSRIEATSCSICAGEWVRALRA
jgi:hypothetical protein